MSTQPSTGPTTWSGTAHVARAGTVLEERSAGFAAGPEGPPCSPDLRSQAGSISKLVVSVVVLRLVEQGVLALDETIAPRLTHAPSQWAGITVGQLVDQTSGLGHWGDVPGLPSSFLTAPPPRDELHALIAAAPLVSPPGRAWRYSGPGFLLASLVVESATGVRYGGVATDLVIRPAGLVATTSGEHPRTVEGVALPHRDGRAFLPHAGFTDLPGTGDLWTTVGDLVRLNRALRAGALLSAESTARLWAPRSATGGSAAAGPVVTEAYGIGTFLGQVKGHAARINPGDNPGYQSLLAYLPEEDLDVAVLCNTDPPSVDAALADLRTL